MSAKSTWNDGWDAGHDDTMAAFKADGMNAIGKDYEPADVTTPDADPGFDRAAWEDGYMVGAQYAREPLPVFDRTTNPHS